MDTIVFANENIVMLIVTALVAKLGGTIEITQSDVDAIAYNLLQEEETDAGVRLTLIKRTATN